MILSWYSPNNFHYSTFFQIICRTEIKSLHLILPCALLGQFDETRMISEKNCKSVQYCEESAMGRLLQALECCYFDRGTRIILRDFLDRKDLEWEIFLHNIYSLVASLIITFTFCCTLYYLTLLWRRPLSYRNLSWRRPLSYMVSIW